MIRFATMLTMLALVCAAGATEPAVHHDTHQHTGNMSGAGGASHAATVDMPADEAPTIALSVSPLPNGDLVLHLATSRFRFAREHVDGEQVSGEGHAHLYVDGKKITRVYAAEYQLTGLSPGVHELRVSLHANNHPAYAADGVPVADRVVIKIGKPGSVDETAASVSKHFDLALHHGKLTGGPQAVRVTQGDSVDLRWSSDETVQLHLHGYDIEATVTPDSPVTMQFDAHATGRFAVELHGGTQQGSGHGHHALTHIEVYPR